MGKSLGDYNLEQSSSFNLKNIKWTQKNPSNIKKPKQSKNRNLSSLNHSSIPKTSTDGDSSNKLFIVESLIYDKQKNKKSAVKKRFQNSSATISKVEQGFKRPGR
ncbi:MAG: hypothetical protein ACRBB2_01030 [Nitrosopumilus sp.]